MSNLSGNYKISVGEVQGVDVLREREQERRARMQLLDDIREPSPQPIFGEPVKVELEDETSRRIKNTLGDFTQVLTNDPKNLIGISRSTGPGHLMNGHMSNGYLVNGYSMASHSSAHISSGYSTSGHPNTGYSSNGHPMTGHLSSGNPVMGHTTSPFVRPQAAYKKLTGYVVNGANITKPSMPNYPNVAPKAPDKRINYNRSDKPGYNYKPESPATLKANYHSSTVQQPYQAPEPRSRDPTAWDNKDQRRANPQVALNINVNVESNTNVTINNINVSNNSISTSAPIWNCGPDTPAIQINPFHLPANATPTNLNKTVNYGQNSTTYSNIPATNKATEPTNPPKRNPARLKIQPEPKEPVIAVETILKEMTKAVPPAPLTAIQTPRTEETGFAFPAEQKEETSFMKEIEQISLIEPFDDPEPELKSKDVAQPSSKPWWSLEELAAQPKLKPAECKVTDSATYEQAKQWKSANPQPTPAAPEPVAEVKPLVADESNKPDADPFSNKYVSSSLQDDLEMSDSDEELVNEVKSNPEQFLTSTASDMISTDNATVSTNNTNNNPTMETNSADSSNSSSSESGSESDDSSSDSGSDSSSEASDEEISSKKWGLSNFVDETQRIHSPAFLQTDATAKETLRLQAERMKNLLNNLNTTNTTSAAIKDTANIPVTEQSTFLVPNVPVTSTSEILSPIPSPMHPAVGPRTPPSPSGPLKQDSVESNVSESQTVKSPIEAESSEDVIEPSVQNDSPQPDAPSCDLTEEKGNVQIEKCKKQLRSSNVKTEETNSEVESSPIRDSFTDEHSDSKEPSDVPIEKDSDTSGVEKAPSSPVTPEAVESPPENYSIKTRQRVSAASSAKKNKSSADNSSESSQKTDVANSPGIAKLKHPRACRKSTEKQNKKTVTNTTTTKPDVAEQPKKRIKQETKETKSSSEKVKESAKSSNNARTGPKPGRKSKTTKLPSKQTSEVKKPEAKKKKKFAIENFLQSPENERPDSTLPLFSPSPERSPIPECERGSPEESVEPLVSTNVPLKTTKNSKKSLTNKNVEKLRRSVRCSERASNNAQVETPVTSQANNENIKTSKNVGRPKSNVDNLLSIEGVDRLELLSPIPMDPSVSTELSDCAIPRIKIMVCIPLDKLTRLPAILQQTQESENTQGRRSRSTSVDDSKPQKKDSESPDKPTKTVVAKCSQSKELKDKTKTVPPLKNSKNNIKNVSANKKEKINKPVSEVSSKSKTSSSVNKNSIKTKDKTLCDDTENTLPKKRKNESKESKIIKKKKILPRTTDEKKPKDQPPAGKVDSAVNLEDANKTKTLERCDSTGSLSSLCSQQSQRSSKSTKEKKKDAPACTPDSKRLKMAPVLLKDIKQEKDDRSKIHIKKEPKTSDKNKTKSRDKSLVKDAACSEKTSEQLWDDSITSSQPFHWDDQCKDDSKEKLVTNQSLSDTVDRELSDWDHFAPEMHKELKEPSTLNKHNNQGAIMPMDYYWTEGRKQRQIAEKEKDPFQQVVKYFEAAVLFILTSQQKEECSKDPDAIYQFYDETLKFFEFTIQTRCKKLRSCTKSTEFKLLILCLKSMSLLNVKLYNIKIKEIKEQLDGVTDFLQHHSAGNPHNSNLSSRFSGLSSASSLSPHSTIPSPSSSIASSQSSGYSSISEPIGRSSSHQSVVNVPQSILDMMCRQHIHLLNLHRGHDRWEQADMYMTRSNLREFFKEVADQSEPLTLHSSITELIKYIQKGISLVKKSLR